MVNVIRSPFHTIASREIRVSSKQQNRVLPFLGWAGGKRWLVQKYSHLFPPNFDRFYEPFLGSGAVFFHLCPEKSVLSDLNRELITTYCAIKKNHEAVLGRLCYHKKMHSDSYFYEMRAKNFVDDADVAARLIYLNRTCWNALYRVNLKGQFNVPRGSKSEVIYPFDDFSAVSSKLQGAELRAGDFSDNISSAGPGDFVFIDPPYSLFENNIGFRKYNDTLFCWKDQLRLREVVAHIVKNGAKVLITNANEKCLRDLYAESGQIHTLSRQSVLAANAVYRSGTREIAVTLNYEVLCAPNTACA